MENEKKQFGRDEVKNKSMKTAKKMTSQDLENVSSLMKDYAEFCKTGQIPDKYKSEKDTTKDER